jgi:hypothetical protein
MYTGLGECRIECFAIKRKIARVKVVVVEDARIFEACFGFGVPAAVSAATVSVLPRVFAAIAESAVDAAAPVAVFSPDPLVAPPPSRVPVLAAAEVFGAPALAVCGVDPDLADAYCPAAGYR